MDIILEALANAAFIVGFFFGPAFVLQVYRAWKGSDVQDRV